MATSIVLVIRGRKCFAGGLLSGALFFFDIFTSRTRDEPFGIGRHVQTGGCWRLRLNIQVLERGLTVKR
jgi:hypothetical protein